MFGEFYDKKNGNLMTLDNFGIDYAQMFSCLLENLAKTSRLLAPPATPGLLRDDKAVTSMLSKK